ncbi:oligosaccharide flippase family protein [Salegentibacter salarius]|uniref:Polysaccharide biosynthesis protein n=1 Tax=Salegentibacter salarius TaxID=435906 RepID=A0A2N0U4U9_9FLAO|nr:oligosaccharide flippase family protein [Salegentibacter salarius]OEY71313.1 polysaccharide biosynthesis protein [Salegentibacter salarius]PKD21995.1 polysaccharide biosynthesis protein [Salegentibacter salarius]SLJ92474.1 Membrane protein involved in the export of O-antigen and teichoic acid [Salegentibacter salarius]
MGTFKKLFQQTFVYGLATVLPRMLNVIMVPLYTHVLPKEEYGEVSIIFAYFVFFNVILAYGMETAFFRFYNKMKTSREVLSTSGWSIVATSILFFTAAFLAQDFIAEMANIPVKYIQLVIWILLLDALVIIPFTWLRAAEKPMRFAVIKIINVCINLGLNIFFLLFLKDLAIENSVFQSIYIPDFEISYIFISNLVASGATLLMMLPFYFKIDFSFNAKLWKSMMSYAFPVLIAGLAFSVNEVFDRIMLDYLLPQDIARAEIGAYAACYKLALFMTLFATAFRLGIEPFFFSHAENKNAPETYAIITKYFVVFGSFILVAVIVFIDVLKQLLIQDSSYWEAMHIVPLILLANLFLGIYHNLSVWYKITDRTRFGGYISVVGALFTLALNIILIPYISYTGSAIATLVAYGVMMLLSYFYGRKYYPIPYNLKKIGGYLVLSVLFSVFSFYVFRGNYFVGISLLIVFLGTVYVSERKQLIKILQS